MTDHGAPTPEDVATARRVVGDIKRAARPGVEPAQPLVVTEEALESVLRLGVRLIPGFRGAVGVEPWGLEMRASVPLPLPGAQRWVNISVSVPQFEDRSRCGASRSVRSRSRPVSRWSWAGSGQTRCLAAGLEIPR